MRYSHASFRYKHSMKRREKLPLKQFLRKSALAKTKRSVDRELRKRNSFVGAKLGLARREARLTQTQVASMFGRHQTFIAKLEAGVHYGAFVEVEKLAAMYGKTLSDFWDDIPPVLRYRPHQ